MVNKGGLPRYLLRVAVVDLQTYLSPILPINPLSTVEKNKVKGKEFMLANYEGQYGGHVEPILEFPSRESR